MIEASVMERWMSGLYFQIRLSHDILLYVFRPYICLYDFHYLLIVGCTILDHLLENLITTEMVMKKFMVCMKLYGV